MHKYQQSLTVTPAYYFTGPTRMTVTFYFRALYLLFSLLNFTNLFADKIEGLRELEAVARAINPAWPFTIDAHPFTVFEDSYEYLREKLPDFRLLKVRFVDDGKVDVMRWIQLMSTQIFAPAFGLFERVEEEGEQGVSLLPSMVFSGPTGRDEETHLGYLRVAGRFCGRLLQMGRVLDYPFVPEVYQQILNPGDRSKMHSTADIRLSAFVGGVREAIPVEELVNVSPSGLGLLINGLTFAALPAWRPQLKLDFEDFHPHDSLTPDNIKRTYEELSTDDVALLWKAVSGMRNIPISELSPDAEGFTLKGASTTKVSVTGLYFDSSRRTIEICPRVLEDCTTSIWEYFEKRLTLYTDLNFSLRRVPSLVGRPTIELPLDDGKKIIDALCILPRNLRDIIQSEIVVAGKDGSLIIGESRFFFVAFTELANPASGLFTISCGESTSCIGDISLEAVEDENRHLRRLYAAGVVWGKAFQASAQQVGFFLAPKLESLAVLRTSPMPNDNHSNKDASLFTSRSAAFIRGIHNAIPAWAYSYLALRPNGHPYMTMPSLFRAVRKRTSLAFAAPQVSEKVRKKAEMVQNWFWTVASTSDWFKSRLFFLLLVGRPMIHFASLLLEPTTHWKLIYDPEEVAIKISKGTIVLPKCKSQGSMKRLFQSALGPAKHLRLFAGVPAPEQDYPLPAPRGQLFETIYALYLEAGWEQFIKWKLQIIIVEGGHRVKTLKDPADYGFLLLEEALSVTRGLFTYALDRDGFGRYDVSRKPVKRDEAQLSMLRFVGVFLAKLIVLEDVALDFPLTKRLQSLLYMDETAFKGSYAVVEPLSMQENSLVAGFHSVIPANFFQSISFNQWTSYVDLDSNTKTRLIQRASISNYGYFIALCQLHVAPHLELDEEIFATWENYENFVAETPLTASLPPVREIYYLSSLIDEAVHPANGLFVDEGGAIFNLSKGATEASVDQDERLERLYRVGYLIGKGIQSSLPIGRCFSRSLYARLRRGGVAAGDDQIPELMLRRIYAFVNGIFAAIPSNALGTLTEEEIALLFEWDTQPIATLAKSIFRYPKFPKGSNGFRCIENFHKAITSLPDEVGWQFILEFQEIIRIPLKGFDQLSMDSIDVVVGMDEPSTLIKVKATESRIDLWPFATVEDFRVAICANVLSDDFDHNRTMVEAMELELEERLRVLRHFGEAYEPPLQLTINRHDIFGSTFELYEEDPQEFGPRRMEIQFMGVDGLAEEGRDAGGLSNEWIGLFFQQILESTNALFSQSSTDEHYHFSGNVPKGFSGDLHHQYEFIGTMVGRAFLSGVPINMRFAPIVYTLLLHDPVSEFDYYAALATLDPNTHSLLEVAKTSDNPEELEIDFTLMDSSTGRPVYLKSAKDNPEVTKENVDEYVTLMARYALLGQSHTFVEAFVSGFHAMVDWEELRSFGFTAEQIESMIFGVETIDVADWRRNTVHSGLDPQDASPNDEWYRNAIVWFWKTLEAFKLEQRRQVLHYATGLLRVPFGGFKGLPGGTFELSKAINPTPHRMPEAVTCLNTLRLHPYDSEEELRTMLLKAIEWAGEGFGNI